MIAGVLGALLLQAVPVPTVADEVTVIGQKLQTWRASYKSRGGKTRCVTMRSSGDREIDAIGCSALTSCGAEVAPRAVALAKDKALSNAERKAANDLIEKDLGHCLVARRDAGVAALADKRAAARLGS